MSKEELPSINDILGNSNLPSYKDFLEKKEELPSVEEYITESNQNTVEEETQTIENADGESFLEVVDVVKAPEWAELVRLVNDVRKDIPQIPEIKSYDNELSSICEQITQIQTNFSLLDAKSDKIADLSVQNKEFEGKLTEIESKIPEIRYSDDDIQSINDKITTIKEELNSLPEVKYYEEDLESLKTRIEQVSEAIPAYPDWIQEVQEVPDFSWIGKTFSLIDDDFNKVQGHLDIIREKIDYKVKELNDSFDKKEFELRIDIKNLTENFEQTVTNLGETRDKLIKEVKDVSRRIWEQHHISKDDDKKLKKSILSEQNKLKQSLQKEIESINEQSVKADESILNFFVDLKETVDSLPQVKYYDEDVSRIDEDILSIRKELKELLQLASLIKTEQTELKENYLLNEPPSEKETAGNQTDPLTPLDQKFATLDDLASHYRLFINRITTQLSTIGGGGAGFIKDLDDVDISGLQDGYILEWESASNKWKVVANSGGGVGAAGTWGIDSVGIHTVKSVGINTSSAVTGKSLYVDGDVQFTGNLSVGGTITYEDVKNIDSIGIVTARTGVDVLAGGINVVGVSTISTGVGAVHVGAGSTALLVDGDARVTGILTIGSGSITLDPNAKKIEGIDEIIIGTGTTVRIHQDTSGEIVFSDREGKQASVGIGTTVSINTTGIITASSFRGDGSQLTNIISGVGIQSGSVRIGTGFTDINFTGVGITVVGSGTTVTVDIPSSTITRQTETSSGVTTDFTITDGYTVGLIDVFLNGVKQRSGVDFTASDGSTVTMTPFISDGDVVEFQKYDKLNIAGITSVTNATNAYNIVGGVSFATSAGIATALNSDSSINTSGIITASQLAVSGLSTSKDLLVTGITSATNIIEIKSNDSTPGRIDLYCETNNAHYARLQAPEHGDFGGNITVKLPASTGTLLLSDGSGASLTSLNASNLGSGTIPDARFPATLPAISGQNLTGIVTGITAGSNITVLESPSGNFIITATGGGGGDTVSINASVGDILSASSGEISADDAGSDKLVFWDDSESKLTYLTAGSGLSISGTTITASGGGGSSGVEIENNGTSVGTGITAINFSTNVTATASGGIATVTASGGGGGSDGPSSVMMGMIF